MNKHFKSLVLIQLLKLVNIYRCLLYDGCFILRIVYKHIRTGVKSEQASVKLFKVTNKYCDCMPIT